MERKKGAQFIGAFQCHNLNWKKVRKTRERKVKSKGEQFLIEIWENN